MNNVPTTEDAFLSPPKVPRVRYHRNFIKNAVCELRFPTLLELESKPPKDFQAKLRKLYPHYESQLLETLGGPDSLPSAVQPRYLFKSKKKDWTVSLTSSSFSLETSAYTDFEEFISRISFVIECAKDLIDSDFFTRVGLRYINTVPMPFEDGSPKDWINPELVQPVIGDVLCVVFSSATVYQGVHEHGLFTMRHGFKMDGNNSKETGVVNYTLDFDYFQENVEEINVLELLRNFNETNFYLFSWCIGEKARELLGESKPK